MATLSRDTQPAAERFMLEGLRRMSGADRLRRAFALRDAALSLAAARLAEQGLSPREIQLRLAATWLPADVMRRAFRWDPVTKRPLGDDAA